MLNRFRISEELRTDFINLCKSLIEEREENKKFYINPDDPEEHVPKWHKYGIITHSLQFLLHHREDITTYIKKEPYFNNIVNHLEKTIDNTTLDELLQIAILLHDIGKFKRHFTTFKQRLSPNYKNHEQKSKDLILNNIKVKSFIKKHFNLSQKQIEYVAECAGLHYELGKVRRKAKKTNYGYSQEYIDSDLARKEINNIIASHDNFKIEIGLLFLGDSLAKGIKNEEQQNNIKLSKEYFKNIFT